MVVRLTLAWKAGIEFDNQEIPVITITAALTLNQIRRLANIRRLVVVARLRIHLP